MNRVSRRPSTMEHSFARVPSVNIPRSQFDRSHGYKSAFSSGYLVPFFVDEALPGDSMSLRLTAFVRMATALRPIMDNLYFETFFFSIPMRLVWDNWEKFCGAQDNPGDSIDYTVPEFANDSGGVAEQSLHDYMGVPPGINNLPFSALYARCYNLVWNEWFRSQSLQDSVTVDTGDASGDIADYVLLRRGKRHDYFTSALPAPQRGDSVLLPLGDTAPVEPIVLGTSRPRFTVDGVARDLQSDASGSSSTGANFSGVAVNNPPQIARWFDPQLQTDLSAATAATINTIRQAFQVQRLLERDARGGTRYPEILMSHYKVRDPMHAVIQRPVYLGGGSTAIYQNLVPATAESTGVAIGDLQSYGTAQAEGHGFVKSFTEHCIVLGLCNVRADLTYQQGLPRMFSRQTRYDFMWPTLSMLGEQSILNKELFATGLNSDNDTFGYIPRYDEYRYKNSMVTGRMRSNAAAPLDIWHLSIDFSAIPNLNASFIEDNPPVSRVIATPSEPEFIMDAWFDLKHARPMPLFGVPGMVDHF